MGFERLKRIDAHCHVNFPAYGDDKEDAVERALSDGTGMICIGTEMGTSRSAVETARGREGVWAAVGFHPSHLSDSHRDADEMGDREAEGFSVEALHGLVSENRDLVVGIGECGLDRHHLEEGDDVSAEKDGQEKLFRAQIDLALEFDLPVIVHCRDLQDEVFEILEDYRRQGKEVKGVAHCFTGTWAEAQRYLDFGFYVSFAGMVTYKPRAAERESGETLQDVAKRVPLGRLLVETDAPYLLPMPHRGKKVEGKTMNNEPAFVRHTSEFIAGLRDMPVEEFEAAVLQNTIRCFSLK